LFCEEAVAAAEIEDMFPRLWGEESDDIGGEIGDEAAIGGVGIGVPGLAGLALGGGVDWRHGVIVRLRRRGCEEHKNFRGGDKRCGLCECRVSKFLILVFRVDVFCGGAYWRKIFLWR